MEWTSTESLIKPCNLSNLHPPARSLGLLLPLLQCIPLLIPVNHHQPASTKLRDVNNCQGINGDTNINPARHKIDNLDVMCSSSRREEVGQEEEIEPFSLRIIKRNKITNLVAIKGQMIPWLNFSPINSRPNISLVSNLFIQFPLFIAFPIN